MLGKLKKMAAQAVDNGMAEKAIDKLCPELKPHIEKLTSFSVTELTCNDTFTAKFIKPAQIALVASTYGATKLIPGFDDRFTAAMLHTRDELCLIDTDNNKVALTTDAIQRLPQVLQEGFKKSA